MAIRIAVGVLKRALLRAREKRARGRIAGTVATGAAAEKAVHLDENLAVNLVRRVNQSPLVWAAVPFLVLRMAAAVGHNKAVGNIEK